MMVRRVVLCSFVRVVVTRPVLRRGQGSVARIGQGKAAEQAARGQE